MLSKCIILSCMMWLHFPSSVSAVSPLDIVLSFLFSRWFGSMHSLFHTQSSNRILRYSNLYRIPRMCLWCCLRPCLLLYFSSNSLSLSLSFARLLVCGRQNTAPIFFRNKKILFWNSIWETLFSSSHWMMWHGYTLSGTEMIHEIHVHSVCMAKEYFLFPFLSFGKSNTHRREGKCEIFLFQVEWRGWRTCMTEKKSANKRPIQNERKNWWKQCEVKTAVVVLKLVHSSRWEGGSVESCCGKQATDSLSPMEEKTDEKKMEEDDRITIEISVAC